jgi:hypothetical protein
MAATLRGAGDGMTARMQRAIPMVSDMSVPERAWKLDDLSPRSYQHPADRAATAALQRIPYLDEVVKRLIALGYERALRAASLGASVRLGQDQLPHIWVLHREVFNVLDIADVPDL